MISGSRGKGGEEAAWGREGSPYEVQEQAAYFPGLNPTRDPRRNWVERHSELLPRGQESQSSYPSTPISHQCGAVLGMTTLPQALLLPLGKAHSRPVNCLSTWAV